MFSKLRTPTLYTSLIAAALTLGAGQAFASDKEMIKDVKDMSKAPVVEAESLKADSELNEEELKEMMEKAESEEDSTSDSEASAE